jgi:hypothetical protein
MFPISPNVESTLRCSNLVESMHPNWYLLRKPRMQPTAVGTRLALPGRYPGGG